ncbi:ABC transporter ATP-binding protein YtrB [Anaerohalosphaera lusitana]|uniref:ABC transporter ATP-binding protein YtrB n=1 Tax=Anaerohalosphaera lusitana TaxID=1936003 RepID=A0A1U9NIT9_9BACT|nr:ABC transporter ATP-binding protein [Anaerohalosphaera lusitana]AQT67510.1 ABC transporter ATP-binding protein YtrB [Anaerohalosphaera lusitana]
MSGNVIVEMRDVVKWFGHVQALDHVSLDVRRGEIIGLLGANGAGKSTLLRCVIGLYLADRGTCRTFGVDAAKLGAVELGRIGYVHQEGELLDWMTVGQLIRYVSAYYDTWDRELEERYVADFDISLRDRVGALSPGQRQKVAILLAIGFGPELLILDEPASALDPLARRRFLDMLLGMIQEEGRSIIISSHILSDVEKVIDHAVIMQKGEILRDRSFDELREEYLRFRLTSLNGELPGELGFAGVLRCERNDRQAVLTVQHAGADELEVRAKELRCDIEFRPLSLEEIYELVVS